MPLTLPRLERHLFPAVDILRGNLHEPHHAPEFSTWVERAMPDFAQRKPWPAEHASEAVQL